MVARALTVAYPQLAEGCPGSVVETLALKADCGLSAGQGSSGGVGNSRSSCGLAGSMLQAEYRTAPTSALTIRCRYGVCARRERFQRTRES